MAKAEKIVQAKVAKRKSVDIEGKLYGPGSLIELPISEAEDLLDKGFVVDPSDFPAPAEETSGPSVEEREE